MNKLFEQKMAAWKTSVLAPIFPIIFMEVPFAKEIRGFENLEQVIGDWDFSGYPNNNEAIIIDSTGQVFNLVFDTNLLVPNCIWEDVTNERLYEILLPSLIESKDKKGLDMIMRNSAINEIINYLAEKYCW